jgi:L-alanine-DL-glutamate epimerase-like enolase superfamily enzyme
VRIAAIRDRTVPISRYADPAIPSGGLTTSIVALTTDVVRAGTPVIGFGFSSIGRFGQHGLIWDRFAPRLLQATEAELADADGSNLDPQRAWQVMMRGEKPGGHGERCVAVGALDMAVWDAAAKIAEMPLHRFLRKQLGIAGDCTDVAVYASGGYRYPAGDVAQLTGEVRLMRDAGYTHVKIKIGAPSLDEDIRRIEAVLGVFPGEHVAVDAMNAYDAAQSGAAARRLQPYGLRWFEDICDPHDFATLRDVASTYAPPIAAGEAIFSAQEAVLMADHGGLRPERDILLFDPAHCYGIPGFVRIVEAMRQRGWPASAFWPHGGHLYTLHVAAALGLGGSELNPHSFAPFGGVGAETRVIEGRVTLPNAPGIGFETKSDLYALFRELV